MHREEEITICMSGGRGVFVARMINEAPPCCQYNAVENSVGVQDHAD